MLGPNINAGGRLKDSTLGIQLLTASTEKKAFAIATQLADLNRQR